MVLGTTRSPAVVKENVPAVNTLISLNDRIDHVGSIGFSLVYLLSLLLSLWRFSNAASHLPQRDQNAAHVTEGPWSLKRTPLRLRN